MRIWSWEWWKCCDTSAVRLRPSCLHASRRVDPGDLATTIKFDYKRFLNACQLWLCTWWQSLSSLSMGTVNQYKLITWLDPMGTKTSSINQRLHLPGSCASPSVRQRWRREGTICANVCVCVCVMWVGGYILWGTEKRATSPKYKVMNTIATWFCLLILDHLRRLCLSLVITSTPCKFPFFK